MTIYLDYVFFINFLFDFILLYGINITLKRNIHLRRLVLAAVLGGLFSFIVFIPVTGFVYFFLKVVTGFLMVLLAFSYRSFKYSFYNLVYLMVLSIILGGCLYLLNISFGYDHQGFLILNNGKKLNTIILVVISLLLIIFYKKINFYTKIDLTVIYHVKISYEKNSIKLKGLLDTGNVLKDPYTFKPVFIINKGIIDPERYIFVPYKTIKEEGLMKCFYVDYLEIENVTTIKKALIGIGDYDFKMGEVDIILNRSIMEDI